MIGIIAALPRELALLTRGWKAHRQQQHRGIYVWSHGDAIAVAAGMGPARATLAVQAAVAAQPKITELWSVGLAGACNPALAVGAVLDCATTIDARTGERLAAAAGNATLVTGATLASVREKARLFQAYAADAVDMEAATVARLALAHGFGFRAFKAVSDDHAFELGPLDRFTTTHGHFHTRAFALHTAVRPHTWRRTMRLGRHSQAALKALTARLEAELRGEA